MALSLKPLHPTFGAECGGVDFSRPVPGETVEAIRQAMARYGVLVFRRTALDDARHQELARQFGEPDVSAVSVTPGQKHRLAPFMELADAGNLDADGRLAAPDSLWYQGGLGNRLFHVDCSYNARRAVFSILRAHRLPARGTGGMTAFADTRAAYDGLDAATKARVHDYVLCHSILQSCRLAAPDYALFRSLRPDQLPSARHRLVQRHEPSGRTNLYLAAHAYRIDGWSEEDSAPVIRELLAHAAQDKYTFAVEWEDDGDVIMWDKTCVMHKACGGSFDGKYPRDMRRVTVYDSSSTAWGLNRPEAP